MGVRPPPAQRELIRSLRRADAYPHPTRDIRLLETHISWVLLSGDYAYKIKKAITLEFLDFATLEKRHHFCEEELRLNRPWAEDLYLGVVPITGTPEKPAIDGDGEVIDYALKMRQFPQDARLDARLAQGLVDAPQLAAFAETVASHHGDSPPLAFRGAEQAIDRLKAPMHENFPPLESHADAEMLDRIRDWTEHSLGQLEEVLVARHRDGCVRDVHGDLRLANLVALDGRIVAFDCVEFSDELRNIDVISDVAFLVMDLCSGQRADLAFAFLNRYLECSGDYEGMAVLGLYYVYHAMIRAKVDAIRLAERDDEEGRAHDRERIEHYCRLSLAWIERPPPRLIAMYGYAGSGKTWLSSRILHALPAIRVRSDIERKRLFGLAEAAGSDSGVGEGIYTAGAKSGVYDRLAVLARGLLAAGCNVIADASFLKREDRQRFARLADELGVPFVLVEARAPERELRRRLRQREQTGRDASEADEAVLERQLLTADEPDADERRRTVKAVTEGDVDIEQVVTAIRRF